MKICKCEKNSKYEPDLCSDTIPGGSWLLYEVELLQVSDQGIDLFDELDVDQNEELTLEEVFHWIFTESFCFLTRDANPGSYHPSSSIYIYPSILNLYWYKGILYKSLLFSVANTWKQMKYIV